MLSPLDLKNLAALGGNIAELVAEVERLRDASVKPTVPPESPLRVGNNVFIRTVTHHYTGQIVKLTDTEIVLVDAAWIADDGRFSNALKTGVFNDVEPYHAPVSVGRGAVCDVTDWTHKLPRDVK